MATHGYGGGDSVGYCSVSKYRRDIERADRLRQAEKFAKETGSVVTKPIGQAVEMLERPIQKAIREDKVGREALAEYQTVKAAGSLVTAGLLIVAATAAEAIHAHHQLKEQERAENAYKDEVRNRVDRQSQTLSDLSQRVADSGSNFTAQEQQSRAEYHTTRNEAQRTIDLAKQTHEQERLEIKRDDAASETRYKQAIESADKAVKSAETTRDRDIAASASRRDDAIKTATHRYEADERRIRSMFSGAELDRELSVAVARRDNAITQAQATHDSNTQRSNATYDSAVQTANATRSQAEETRRTEREALATRTTTSDQQLQTTINTQTEIIRTAQTKAYDSIGQSARDRADAQRALDKYQTSMTIRGTEAIAAGSSGKSAMEMGCVLANRYGVGAESAIMTRVSIDLERQQDAERRGVAYTPFTTEAERSEAAAITQKYAVLAGKDLVCDLSRDRDEIKLVKDVAADIKAESKALAAGKEYKPETTPAQRAMALQITQQYAIASQEMNATYNTHPGSPMLWGGSERFADAVGSKQVKLGHDLALHLGDDKEKSLMQKVDADRKAERDAEKNGTTYVRTTTDAERREADRITQKYAGDLTTPGGVKKTIAGYQSAIGDLTNKTAGLQQDINALTKQQQAIDGQIKALKVDVDAHTADLKALKTGKTASGLKLTPEQRKEIEARVAGRGDMTDKKNALQQLFQDRKDIAGQIKGKQGEIAKTNDLIEGLKGQVTLLKKGGKTLADTMRSKGGKQNALEKITNQPHISLFNRLVDPVGSHRKVQQYRKGKKEAGHSQKGQKMQAKGVSMVFGSIKKLSRQFQRSLDKGDIFKQELRSTARTMSNISRYYSLALTVGGTALTVASMTGKLAGKVGGQIGGVLMKCGNHTLTVLGIKSRLSKTLSKFAGSKFVMGASNVAGVLGRGAGTIIQGQMNLAGAILKAPIAILNAPQAIMNLPQTMARKGVELALRGGRHVIGATVGGTARLAGKTALGAARVVGLDKAAAKAGQAIKTGARNTGRAIKNGAKATGRAVKAGAKTAFNKTIGKQTWYKKASKFASDTRAKIAGIAKKIFSPIADIGSWIKKKLGALIAVISSAITWLISTAASVLMFAIGFLLGAGLIIVVILIIILLLMSVIQAITEWIEKNKVSNKALVQNDPTYIMNQAVNYRDAELEIFDLFYHAYSDKSLIRINESPIYYALYDNNFHWFGITGEDHLSADNSGAYYVFTNYFNRDYKITELINSFDADYEYNYEYQEVPKYTAERAMPTDLGSILSSLFPTACPEWDDFYWHFQTDMPYGYDYIHLDYYHKNADNFKTDSDGKFLTEFRGEHEQYILKPGALKSNYEISNAKDALVLVDTLYTNKMDTMQKVEVLAYLGVGDYQMSSNATANDADDSGTKQIRTNLFWATHSFIYKSGNLPSDLWYHVTKTTTETRADGDLQYSINNSLRYTGERYANGNYKTESVPTDSAGNARTCGNKETLVFEYETTDYDPRHTCAADYTDAGYGEYNAITAITSTRWTKSKRYVTASELYYSMNAKYYNRSCSHTGDWWINTYYGGTTTGRSVYQITTRASSANGALTAWRNNDESRDRLNFYRYSGNKYNVVDQDGQFMGRINISQYAGGKGYEIYDMVTTFYAGSKTYTHNKSGYGLSLDNFYLYWDYGSGRYRFRHVVKDYVTTASDSDDIEAATWSIDLGRIEKYYYNEFDSSAIVVNCCNDHSEEHSIEVTGYKNMYMQVCRGHMDLDVAVAVSTINEGDEDNNDPHGYFFEDAQKVEGILESYVADSILGLYTVDYRNQVSGWGMSTYEVFNPYEDWGEVGGMRGLATAKTKADLTYSVSNDLNYEDFEGNIQNVAMQFTHEYAVDLPSDQIITFWSLGQSNEAESKLLFAMACCGNVYYVESFISGEQKDLQYYRLNDSGTVVGNGTVSFNITPSTGQPWVG